MDTKYAPAQRLKVTTFPYAAPEASEELSGETLMKMDVYSFGLLFWQVLLDGKDLAKELGLPFDKLRARSDLQEMKSNDEKMLTRIWESIGDHLPAGSKVQILNLIAQIIWATVRTNPVNRFLGVAQAALRNGHVEDIPKHLNAMVERNSSEVFERQDGIQHLSFNVDRIGFQLGKMGDFYDAQENLPGYRVELPHPPVQKFLFEPTKIKSLLSWEQQVQIMKELKEAALAVGGKKSPLSIPPFKAAFYLFQSYLTEFGTRYDPKEVCYWLKLAAEADDEWEEEMFAQAWLWRVCDALHHPPSISKDKLVSNLGMGIVYGIQGCSQDWRSHIETITDDTEKTDQIRMLRRHQNLLKTVAGGVGMRHYFPGSMVKQYSLSNISILDQQIREELGELYERSLLAPCNTGPDAGDEDDKRLDKIYVSSAGHGLLHYAATFGKVDVLKHLLDIYKCDIDIGSTLRYESPLVLRSPKRTIRLRYALAR